MKDLPALAAWVAPLRGRALALRAVPGRGALPLPGPDEVLLAGAARALPPGAAVAGSYLRFPGTSGGFVLLDAREPAVLRAGVPLLPHGRALSRLASRLVRASSHAGVARGLASGELVLVQREGGAPHRLGERFPGLPADPAWNVASGVPGRDQKLIVQIATRAGEVRAYAKIALAESSRALVERESRILATLAALGVPAPRSLGLESGAHGTLLVQTALDGRRWHGGFGPAQSRFLLRLERATARRLPLREIPSHRDALAALGRLRARADADWWERMQGLADALLAAAGDTLLPCALAHGDFTSWNSVVAGGEAQAFDWEHARESAPRLHDAFHYVLQDAVLVEHVDPARLREIVELRTAATPPEAWLLQLGAYVLDVSLADEEIRLDERARSPQAGWLRRARTHLARTLIAELRDRGARAA